MQLLLLYHSNLKQNEVEIAAEQNICYGCHNNTSAIDNLTKQEESIEDASSTRYKHEDLTEPGTI